MHSSVNFQRSTTACVALAVLATACGSVTDPGEEAPTLPPDVSMVIDFSSFASGESALSNVSPSSTQVGINWTRAAASIVVWNIALSVTLVTPVAAFIAAANQTPERQEDGSWMWAYDFSVGAVSHTARLEGRFVPQGVQWQMFLTKDGEYSNFLWYSGTSGLLATEGQWNINLHPSNPTPFLQIDWTRDFTTNIGEIRYTNVVPAAAENGGYINYGLVVSSTFDAFYEVSNAENGNMTSIEWSRSSQNGRVRAEHLYQDTNWHCWNGTLDDVVCP